MLAPGDDQRLGEDLLVGNALQRGVEGGVVVDEGEKRLRNRGVRHRPQARAGAA